MRHLNWALSSVLLLIASPSLFAQPFPLVEAKREFTTKLLREGRQNTPLPRPPEGLFSLIQYDAPNGPTSAYLSKPPRTDQKLPAIVWLTGGFPTARGGSYIWTPGPPTNEQSASPYRNAGIVALYPTVRGTGENPGFQELMMGEVEDVLAATEYLRNLDYVDPDRIYLGGHSTGATLALLVAESTDLFRAVFAFGPAARFSDYGRDEWPFDETNDHEFRLRSPIHFTSSIRTPTYVIEGRRGRTLNLEQLAASTDNRHLHCKIIEGSDHFLVLAPMNRFLAQQIVAHRSGEFRIDLDRLQPVYDEFATAQHEAGLLRQLGDLRADGLALGTSVALRFVIGSGSQKRVTASRGDLLAAGFIVTEVVEATEADGDSYFQITATRMTPLTVEATFEAAKAVRGIAIEHRVNRHGWTASEVQRW